MIFALFIDAMMECVSDISESRRDRKHNNKYLDLLRKETSTTLGETRQSPEINNGTVTKEIYLCKYDLVTMEKEFMPLC
jgi:hypothetical protein